MNGKCPTCKFSEKHKREMNTYECRKNPPLVFMVPVQGVGMTQQCMFPLVADSTWCGEYIAKLQ